MKADLNDVGTTPCCNDKLNKCLRNGASSPTHSLSNQVGSGSSWHCSFGSFNAAAVTSSVETAEKPGNAQSSDGVDRVSSAAHRRTNVRDFLVEETVKVGGADGGVSGQLTTTQYAVN